MIKQAQYWLLLNIARTPKIFTYGAGLLIVVVLSMITAATLFVVDESRTVDRHTQAMTTAQALSAEVKGLLDLLNHSGNTDCESSHLIQLNALLMQSRFIREIGVLDQEGRLICATTIGKLPVPISGNYRSITTTAGRQVFVDVPLQVANKKTRATLIRQGQFNVVVSPYLTDQLYASADVVWLTTPDGLQVLKSLPMSSDELAQLRDHAQAEHASTWRVRDTGYELITAQPGSPWVFQTQRSIRAIIHDNSILLIGMLISAVLIASLATGALTPYVLRLRGIENRVRFLCDEAHILLVYQPIFDLNSQRIAGCEVLMRLTEDEHIWMPEQVIPAILRTDLAKRLDHAVARKAIRELCTHLPVQSSTFSVTLNFFPESIDRATLIPVLKGALSDTRRDDITICLEVTEHSLSDHLITETNGLKAEGYQILIDDFGTGYSNLKSVMRLAPDLVKIDKSFVFELEDKTLRSTLIPEIVNIAQAVNASTLAEGIENIDQIKPLAAMGVRYGQGYALARPMELGPFLDFLSAAR